ncbi:MAG: Fe-S cluster assembly protein SufD [Muribaculaceae bacterium]
MTSLQQYIDLYNANRDAIERNAPDAMNALRAQALSVLQHERLPRRGDENYEVTDIESMFAPDYGVNINRVDLSADPAEAFRCDVPNMSTWMFFFYNDIFHASRKSPSLPDSVIVEPFTVAAKNHPELLAKYLGSVAPMQNAQVALNTLLGQEGLLVYVPKGVVLDRPLQLVNIMNAGGPIMAVRRLLIVVGEQAQATMLVCDHTQNQEHSFLTSQVVEIVAEQGAQFDYYDIEESTANTNRCNQHFVRQAANSNVLLNAITLTNGTTRNDFVVNVDGEGAETQLYGMAIEDGKQHIDNHTHIAHNAPHCNSNELFKYVLDDNAVGGFTGRILVAEGSSKVEAYQANRNIVVTDTAKIYTKPQLEIYCDDVKCSHGTAIGQLDQDAIFYMQQRGIPLDQARTLLMQAFMSDVIDKVRMSSLKNRLQHLVEKRFCGQLSQCSECMNSCRG